MAETSNTFGVDLQNLVLKSLFGDKQTREQSQQFSNQPAANALQTQNQAAAQAAQDTLNLSKLGQQSSAGVSDASYANRAQTDIQKAQALQNMSAKGGGSTSMGAGSFASPWKPGSPYGGPAVFDGNLLAQYNAQQGQALQSTKLFGQANADTDIYRSRGLANVQANLQRQLGDADRYNQSQLSTQNFQQQLGLQGGQLAAQKAIAQTQAQGNILSSLFGSMSSGSPNYRYWN